MKAPSSPRERPGVATVAPVIAVLLVALGAAAIRDLVVSQGWVGGTPWLPDALDVVDGLTAGVLVVVASAVAVLLGLLLVLSALKRARPTHHRSDVEPDVWWSPEAVAAVARAVADRAPGVVSAHVAKAGRRKIVVEVVTKQADPALVEQLGSAVTARVRGLTKASVAVRPREVTR